MIWLIGLGGSIGAAVRYALGNWVNKKVNSRTAFPIGTWLLNITGSFLFGTLTQLHLTEEINEAVWYFSGIGFCGAYTTFSTFGNEALLLIQRNKIKLAIIYIATSVVVGILSAAFGYYSAYSTTIIYIS